MGQKINPISLRLQKTNRKYDSSWYSNYHYGEMFLFDLKVRDYLERILKQLKYPEGRALISHFSKGSKINLFAFNPTSSRQQKSGPFGLKGGRLIGSKLDSKPKKVVNLEGQRKVSPALAKNLQRTNELKRPLKALSSKSKALSIDQKSLLANQSSTIRCSEKRKVFLGASHNTTFKQNTNKNGNKWNPFLPYLLLSWYAPSGSQGEKSNLIFDEKTHGDSLRANSLPLLAPTSVPSADLHKVELNENGRKAFFSVNERLFLKPYLSKFANKEGVPKQHPHNTGKPLRANSKQVFDSIESLVVQSNCLRHSKAVSSEWQNNGSHLVPFFALKDTLNPSYLLKAKRLRDSCFGTHASATLTLSAQQKQQVVSKTLSLWNQRAQGSTHPILVSLGADKKTIPFLTKETSCKAVAKSNPVQSKTCSPTTTTTCEASREFISKFISEPISKFTSEEPRGTQNKLLSHQPVASVELRKSKQQQVQSFPLHRSENSLYRCHIEGVLDKQTGSSVKLVPFQVSTERQSALFLAQEVVYFLEKRVSFRKIKSQILKELKNSKIIRGVRITCSGRVGGKSKRAQKAKTETVKQGQTSLGVFSSRIDFAQKSALTSFGLVGVKVWICFY